MRELGYLMRTLTTILIVLAAALLLPSCACPGCPVGSQDGVGVAFLSQPSSAELGALASVLQLIAEEAGPESNEVRVLDAALGGRGLVIARFLPPPGRAQVRGFALLKDGRMALEDRYVRAAAPDSDYLANPRVWPLIPYLYAAGHRLAFGVGWRESMAAAASFSASLADRVETGAGDTLPPRTNRRELARALRAWQRGT